ncbi:hypothetical protein FIBSPDRAFT_3594 [Athelia psychrophila]|uniref:Uncharacterized protein n=1 Tax=Athelia psychrophila TaxID=1759441 RepID=A0A166WZM0_9AGAM|nr:hypothetical protein FIBSPDRAFT_3594 [Fibularhizoctonia sp. CBS 109695]
MYKASPEYAPILQLVQTSPLSPLFPSPLLTSFLSLPSFPFLSFLPPYPFHLTLNPPSPHITTHTLTVVCESSSRREIKSVKPIRRHGVSAVARYVPLSLYRLPPILIVW